jgi:hypothetical protein
MTNIRYVFDLTRRAQGLVLAARLESCAGGEWRLPDYWQCAARNDDDAMHQAAKAAEREWPVIAGRAFNDFVVRFVSERASAQGATSQQSSSQAPSHELELTSAMV